jgi:hypothetical protein
VAAARVPQAALTVAPPWLSDVQELHAAEQAGDQQRVQQISERLNGDRPDIVFFQNDGDPNLSPPRQPTPVQPGMVQNLIKMLDHHQRRQQPVDLMNREFSEVVPQYEKWREKVRERDPNSGQVVHKYPNDWSIRRVEGKDNIFDEGEEMQNCVPSMSITSLAAPTTCSASEMRPTGPRQRPDGPSGGGRQLGWWYRD